MTVRSTRLARLVVGTATTCLSARLATSPGVSEAELTLFRLVNRLPARLELPLALGMQAGSLPAVPASSGLALLSGRPVLARELAVAGGASWIVAKATKRVVRRDRPTVLLPGVLRRGRIQAGLGFPSGHAAVATALATLATPWLPANARRWAWGSVGLVGIARIYVGAHLPIDVIGGVAMGSSIATLVQMRREQPSS